MFRRFGAFFDPLDNVISGYLEQWPKNIRTEKFDASVKSVEN